MTDAAAEIAFPPEARRAFWSEVVGHLCAVALTIIAATLLIRYSPVGAVFGPLGLSLSILVIALPLLRSISRRQIFKLPPDHTPWPLFFGLVRWSPREFSDALPAWQIYAGTYYGPGVGRALGFGFSVIVCTLAVAVLNGPITLPLWLTVPLLLFAGVTVIGNALMHNRLPPKDGTFSLF
ncbi:hypothetical protein [Maricaulis sp.]|uniref:hypothetical protein n=1 Tax=Maricaulis sp. TaxID=1486257 RepID=UPI003A93E304